MGWSELWSALALVMVIEGLLPAISPRGYRKAIFAMSQMDARSIRITGLVTMISGALFLYWLKNG
ncbi:MAG: DUF2065 domain-containing protein [Gammaproteobacteria bacterium]|nr:DUF2065 domain-containing protein [Gammaproteobacteria bacterium]